MDKKDDIKTPAEVSMEETFDRIYADYIAYGNKDTVIPFSEFQKYEILYSSEARRKYLNKEMTTEESAEISKLSEEWYARINPQKPVHIVDDETGEEICPPLPPIFNTLQALGSAEACDLITAFVKSSALGESGGVINQIKSKELAVDVNNMYASNQDPEKMREQVNNFTKMAVEFDKKVLGRDHSNIIDIKQIPNNKESDSQEVNPELELFDEEE